MERGFSQAGRVGYARARLGLLAIGVAILLMIAAMMIARGVVRDEVVGILLFLPVFLAFVFWNEWGGILGGLVATLVYGSLIYGAAQTAGVGRFIGQFVSRSIGYLLFGYLGGWANRQLKASLNKLEIYDLIDDETGLFNARFFIQDTDLEMSRSRRYQTIFSVVLVDIPAQILEPLSMRQRRGLMREIGGMLRGGVRTVDRAAHGSEPTRSRLAVVLPETAKEGALTFGKRLAERLEGHLVDRGLDAARGRVHFRSLIHPDDERELEEVRQEFREIDRLQHPEDIAQTPMSQGSDQEER